jgi:hypothetical protein
MIYFLIDLSEDIREGEIIYENEGDYKERRGLRQKSLLLKETEERCSEGNKIVSF